MHRVLIFGNSGSGKSTLAKLLAREKDLAYLDLDTLAWLPSNPPERAPLSASKEKIGEFVTANKTWVIEGCYTDLLAFLSAQASEIIFMNISIDQCIENARNRPWEAHKYISKEDQDSNLGMLIEWISQYRQRDDVFSFHSHFEFYENFNGLKSMRTENESPRQHPLPSPRTTSRY